MLKELATLNQYLKQRKHAKKTNGEQKKQREEKAEIVYNSNFGRTYSQGGFSGHTPRSTSRGEKENEQFFNTFQQIKDQMIGGIKEKYIH